MPKAILCHGVSKDKESVQNYALPSCAHHFLPWLQLKYLLSGLDCQCPAFLNSWIPNRNYEDDKKVFERLQPGADTRLVGHSCGAGFLLKYLSEHPKMRARHLVLVAPWLDPNGWLGDYFKNFQLDPGLPRRIERIDLFYSTNDKDEIQDSVKRIIETYPAITLHNCGDKGHFKESDLGTREFPELWEVCQKEI